MIYENVIKYANKRNISIAELEKRAGIGNGTIGRWNKSTPNISSLIKVSKVLNVSVNTLIKAREEDKTNDVSQRSNAEE